MKSLLVPLLAFFAIACGSASESNPSEAVELPDSECAAHWGGEGNPSCTTCGCGDPSWSCDISTCMSPAGTVRSLGFEAGFFTIDSYTFEGKEPPIAGEMVPTRLFYAFQPADEDSADKPLFVFFNGGPGCSTTLVLFSFNTSKRTLDTSVDAEIPWSDNPHSFTRLGNVLYIDSRDAGFSYNLQGTSEQLEVVTHSGVDAADVLRVILRFLDRHEPLRDNPVVLVGESWGGARANMIASLARSPADLRDPESGYVDPSLADEIDAHAELAFPQTGDAAEQEELLSRQFGAQVLIQPYLLATLQRTATDALPPLDVSGFEDDAGQRIMRAKADLLDYEVLRAMLGVDPAQIRDLMPEQRSLARRLRCEPEPSGAGTLPDSFGGLSDPDCYFQECTTTGIDIEGDLNVPKAFLSNLAYVDTLITNSMYDTAVRSPAIVEALRNQPQLFSSVEVLSPDDPRGATIRLEARADAIDISGVPAVVEIPFPAYESGHSVPMYQPGVFFADVEAWLR